MIAMMTLASMCAAAVGSPSLCSMSMDGGDDLSGGGSPSPNPDDTTANTEVDNTDSQTENGSGEEAVGGDAAESDVDEEDAPEAA